jgi:predicted RNA-binding protein with PIN domain
MIDPENYPGASGPPEISKGRMISIIAQTKSWYNGSMPIIVDGHNLIPKIPGINLSDIEDEIKLIELLQDYCRLRRVEIVCYFDKAPQGHPRLQRHGQVTAKFARSGKTADEEIKEHLVRLGRSAREWSVVSSDASIQASARASKARIIPSDAFSREIEAVLSQENASKNASDDISMSPEELEMWLKTFAGEQADQENPANKKRH